MKDELFADLMASAEEMAAIEKGEQTPDAQHIHIIKTPDVRAIREAAGKSREEFAKIIGSSEETVKSWENKRRNPTGPSRKLLHLIETNPVQMIELLGSA